MLRKIWDMLFYWKLLMVIVILLYIVAILQYEPNRFGLELNDAIRAPIFALCSAATLFIGMLPKKTALYDSVVDLMIRSVGGLSACLAGWYWLLGETQGELGPYLALLAPILIFIGLCVFVIPFLSLSVAFFFDES